MKILIVSQYFWPETFRINDLASGLNERGHDVTVLTGLPNYPQGTYFNGYGVSGPYNENLDGVRIVRVPLVPRGRKKSVKLILNFLSFAILASVIAPFRCRDKYDAIFVYSVSPVTAAIPALVLKLFKSIPIYHWVADLWPDTLEATGVLKSNFALGLVGAASGFIYRQSNLNLIASAGYRSRLEAMGVAPDEITYWPQWAEGLFTKPLEPGRTVPFPELDGFKILFAGNIGEAQGFPTIVDAAEKLKSYGDIHWVILGDGILKPWVEEQVKERGLSDNFHFLGKCPVEDVPYYSARADALLASLKKDPLFAITVPGKLQSCLASGFPILGSFDGEAAEIIDAAGAGFAAPAGDAEGLANAVLEMVKATPERRVQMGQAGRDYFLRHFERESLFTKLESLMAPETARSET